MNELLMDLTNRLLGAVRILFSSGESTGRGVGHADAGLQLNLYYDDLDYPTKKELKKTWIDHVEGIDIEQFRRNLRETITWCWPRIDTTFPETCLRSEELRPRALDTDLPHYFSITAEECATLISKRRDLVGNSSYAVNLRQMPGRLVMYYGDLNLEEGAMAAESSGYLAGDQPPWDTIVCRIPGNHPDHSRLICWLPDEFVEPVTAALRVQTTDSTWFIEFSEPPLLPDQYNKTGDQTSLEQITRLLKGKRDSQGCIQPLYDALNNREFVNGGGIHPATAREASQTYRLRQISVQEAGVKTCGIDHTLQALEALSPDERILLCAAIVRNLHFVIFLTVDGKLLGCMSVELREPRYPPPGWADGNPF